MSIAVVNSTARRRLTISREFLLSFSLSFPLSSLALLETEKNSQKSALQSFDIVKFDSELTFENIECVLCIIQ